ncbi:MAG: lysophospholipid acyltransferase family protein [Candidatus Hydrogenedentes bacterium]|nr:lysophospholipid acyltransferase family protein [Candidatus Hydrogenedentota bacterium]
MARSRNAVVEWFLTTAGIALSSLTRILPLSTCRVLGRLAGRMAYVLVPRVRKVTMENLTLAYGDTLSKKEKRRIALAAAENVGIVGAEFSRIQDLSNETIAEWVRIEGLEHLPRNQGALIIGAHLGNWEWMASVLSCLGFRMAEIVRPLDDPRMNRYVVKVRESRGVRTVPKTRAGKELIRLLKEGWVVGVLIDQAPRDSAVPVTFFGQPCWATIAPALVAARAKVPIVRLTFVRDTSGTYTLNLSPPIELTSFDEKKVDFAAISQQCQDLVEQAIRAHPEQWLWLHRRWKKRPRLEQEWAARMEKKGAADTSATAEAGCPTDESTGSQV